MTAAAVALRRASPPSSLARAASIGALLAVAIAARWAATVDGRPDALFVGASFGAALLLVATVAGRPHRPTFRTLVPAVAVGTLGGAALVGIAVLVRWPGPWIPFTPAAAFGPWALVTVVVAAGEELVLRGALFDALDEAGGLGLALVVSTVAFALLHVPLYGWHVVPLDLGVGIFLGGLRIVSGGIVAPAVAHALADLATWWL
jgi:membrane protease YdiL (CAAX protease family)